jgi:cell division protein FtsQ
MSMRMPLRRPDPAGPGAPGSGSPSSRPDASATAARRRFARRQWTRRWLAWRYVVALVAAIALVALASWSLYFASWLSVQSVAVHGATTDLPAALVQREAAVPLGKPLLTTDLSAIAARLRSTLPAIDTVEVTRQWPHTVSISVTERTAVAAVRLGGQWRALDAEGHTWQPRAALAPSLPHVLSQSVDTGVLSEAAKVASSLPASIAPGVKVADVEVFTADHIELRLAVRGKSGAGTKSVVWGNSSDSAIKVQVVRALLKQNPDAAQYDVSVPGIPIARATAR